MNQNRIYIIRDEIRDVSVRMRNGKCVFYERNVNILFEKARRLA